MQNITLGFLDYAILAIYVIFVIGIGFALRRYLKSSSDYLTSGRSIPAWVTGLAFMAANLGALELVGMAASGTKYGIATAHFYWVGAIPAMIFLAVFMMPFYYGSKARSVPEYLNMRFDYRTRCVNSVSFAIMTVFASGISMDALAKLLNLLLGWDYNLALLITSAVVLVYVLKGGLTSAIYTEVLQFFMIVLGFAPVVWLGLKDVGGWHSMNQSLETVATQNGYAADAWSSAWKPLIAGATHNPMGVSVFPVFFGLGFVLSFAYWCTNFLVVQRAMAARNMNAARNTPLIAAVPKMLFPALVILPGMLAIALTTIPGKSYRLPPVMISDSAYPAAVKDIRSAPPDSAPLAVKALEKDTGLKMDEAKIAAIIKANNTSPLPDKELKDQLQGAVTDTYYNGVILSLVKRYCPAGLMGLALTALLASFMSGMAGNVTAFNTIWTYDLYQAYIARNRSDRHYFIVGQATTVVGIILSIFCAYLVGVWYNAMDIIQLVFGFVNAPLFATCLLGMFWVRATSTGAFLGLVGGTLTSALFHALTLAQGNTPGIKGGYMAVLKTFPSDMAQNFWLAIFAFGASFTLTLIISLVTKRTKSDEELKGLVYSLTPKIVDHDQPIWKRPAVVGTVLLIACIILNIIFW